MFSSFDGTWTVRSRASQMRLDPITKKIVNQEKTELTYSVYVRPKGPVPIIALGLKFPITFILKIGLQLSCHVQSGE